MLLATLVFSSFIAAPAYAAGADDDGDGYTDIRLGGTDCNDSDATVYPGHSEVCDGVDEDCDGTVDDSATDATLYYRDADRDGYGTSTTTTTSCSVPTGYASNDDDCDDSRNNMNPGEIELCDGYDNDCDGTIDDGVGTTYYRDSDGDGYGDVSDSVVSCSAVAGYVANSRDCDDTSASARPGMGETCDGLDNDCNGIVDDAGGRYWYEDADADGWGNPDSGTFGCTEPAGYTTVQGDCDDTDPAVNSGALEVCNTYDDDCDSLVDEEGTDVWYFDNDGDGYGEPEVTTIGCTAPAEYVGNPDDCDDADAAVNPGASEICNTIDDDCDGTADDGAGTTYYADNDNDSYGDPSSYVEQCEQPGGYVVDASDCDDTIGSIYPGAPEACNGLDDDCDGARDEGVGATWYLDGDTDGYGDSTVSTRNCTEPAGYTSDRSDCDDTMNTVYPGATEYCNDIDDDCDGVVDDEAYDAGTWYTDADADGYGTGDATEVACDAPAGTAGLEGDCYDEDASVNPDGTEVADGIDQDCDGTVDEETENYDDDGDGYTELGGDCQDGIADIYPSAVETCDREDDDCDGVIDEETICYDDDGDGYTEPDGDCNDQNAAISPGATEDDYNGLDDDCDGVIDAGAPDPDGDGYTAAGGDCLEGSASVYPDAPETANGIDDDCDGTVDEGTENYDDDGDGMSEVGGDCDDRSTETWQGAEEVAGDGQDNDCDGVVDEGGPTTDDDGDGFTEEGGDCDDAQASTSPGAAELSDKVDNDCDGVADEDFVDADADGFTASEGDCDDASGWVFPDAEESCDGLDNNCDAVIDENCAEQEEDIKAPGPCGCGSAPGPTSGSTSGSTAGAALVLAAGLLARRRRA